LLELTRVRSLLETLASEAPEEDLELLSVVTEDEREEMPPPSRVEDEREEMPSSRVEDEREEIPPSRMEDERELVPSLSETLRLVSEPLLRNEEFLLSSDELLPVETAERVPDERALLFA